MTIEEVLALIATPMKNEAVKSAYLFSCFALIIFRKTDKKKWVLLEAMNVYN